MTKRPLLFVLLVMMLAWFATTRYDRVRPPHFNPLTVQLRAADRAHSDVLRADQECGPSAHRAIAETRGELRESLAEVNQELHFALREAAEEVRVAVDGIPVPILPGTRVVEALPQPPAPPALRECPLVDVPVQPRSRPVHRRIPLRFSRAARASAGYRRWLQPRPDSNRRFPSAQKRLCLLTGLISATEERAKEEAQAAREGSYRLARAVWRAPVLETLDAANRRHDHRDHCGAGRQGLRHSLRGQAPPGCVSRAADLFTQSYKRQLVHRRMVLLGGTLGFVLICLGTISGYIRADEVTKGCPTGCDCWPPGVWVRRAC